MKLKLMLGFLAGITGSNAYASAFAPNHVDANFNALKTAISTEIEAASKAARKATLASRTLKELYADADDVTKLELSTQLESADLCYVHARIQVARLAIQLKNLETSARLKEYNYYYALINAFEKNIFERKRARKALSRISKKFEAKAQAENASLQVALAMESTLTDGNNKSRLLKELSRKEADALACARRYKDAAVASAADEKLLNAWQEKILKEHTTPQDILLIRSLQEGSLSLTSTSVSASTSASRPTPPSIGGGEKSAFRRVIPKVIAEHGSL